MRSISFQVPAVNTQDEVDRIVATLRQLPGVISIMGHRQTKIFTMTWDSSITTRDIQNTLSTIGYTPDMP